MNALQQSGWMGSPGAVKEAKEFFGVALGHVALPAATWTEIIPATQKDPCVIRDVRFLNRSASPTDLYIAIVPTGSTFDDSMGVSQDDVILLNETTSIAAGKGWSNPQAYIAVSTLNRVLLYSTEEGNAHVSGIQLTV